MGYALHCPGFHAQAHLPSVAHVHRFVINPGHGKMFTYTCAFRSYENIPLLSIVDGIVIRFMTSILLLDMIAVCRWIWTCLETVTTTRVTI